jgi:PAN domain
MEKRIIYLAVSLMILMIFVFPPAHAFTLTFESNIDRPGCDFENFEVPIPGEILCMNACGRDPTCLAWNFDPVHFQGKLMCFLKNCNTSPQSSVGLTSGVKFPFTMSAAEANIDRPGCDIENFETQELGLCSNACGFNHSCEAWSFDPVHFQGPQPGWGMCFLKSCATPPQSSVGVTGGMKFHSTE